jgi:hypothetical protein
MLQEKRIFIRRDLWVPLVISHLFNFICCFNIVKPFGQLELIRIFSLVYVVVVILSMGLNYLYLRLLPSYWSQILADRPCSLGYLFVESCIMDPWFSWGIALPVAAVYTFAATIRTWFWFSFVRISLFAIMVNLGIVMLIFIPIFAYFSWPRPRKPKIQVSLWTIQYLQGASIGLTWSLMLTSSVAIFLYRGDFNFVLPTFY